MSSDEGQRNFVCLLKILWSVNIWTWIAFYIIWRFCTADNLIYKLEINNFYLYVYIVTKCWILWFIFPSTNAHSYVTWQNTSVLYIDIYCVLSSPLLSGSVIPTASCYRYGTHLKLFIVESSPLPIFISLGPKYSSHSPSYDPFFRVASLLTSSVHKELLFPALRCFERQLPLSLDFHILEI